MSTTVHRSFLLGRSMGEAVKEERDDATLLLAKRRLYCASLATHRSESYHDFMAMRGAMLAGGFHRVRLTGGRSIDG